MTSPPREKPQENVTRKQIRFPQKTEKEKLNLISVRVKFLRLHVRIICRLTISSKFLRHVTLSSRVHRVDRIRGVLISISLGGQTGLLFATPHLRRARIFEFSCAITAYGLGVEQVVGDPMVREKLESTGR